MNYDELEATGMFEEGPAAVAADAVLSLRLRLAEMYAPKGPTSDAAYRETVEASLEHVLAHIIQFFTLDNLPWDELVERAKRRAALETFFDEEKI